MPDIAEFDDHMPDDHVPDQSKMHVSDEVAIQITDMNKWYGAFHVLKDINLTVNRGERIVVCGPSGSGKSTLIRCINRLEEHQQGQIIVNGNELTNDLKKIEEIRREVGMVFQSFNLFPHMSVTDNVAVGPRKVLRTPKATARTDALVMLERLGLADRADAYPDQLSGGQQQRVAIARSLAMQPDVMLLDEITSTLDPELVGEVLDVVRDLKADGMTMLFATHEMAFAREISDRVCFLDQGRILESGPPEQIFGTPEQARTREFLQRVIDAGRM